MKKVMFLIFTLFLFCGLEKAWADSNLVRLSDTAHTYSAVLSDEGSAQGSNNTTSGANSIDENKDTYYGRSYGDGQENPPGRDMNVISEHIFSRHCRINKVTYKLYCSQGHDSHYAHGGYTNAKVEYRDSGGNWQTIYNSGDQGSIDTGLVEVNTGWDNITGIRATAHAYAYGSGGGSNRGVTAYIYEVQAWGVVDIGLRAYDGTRVVKIACEPAGNLSSPFRVNKNGTTYAIVLVDPADPRASRVRIKTNSGIKALAKLN